MNSSLPQITFVIHDEEGGVAAMNHRIIDNGGFQKYFRVRVVLWKPVEEKSRRFRDNFEGADDVIRFDYSRRDNYYLVLRRFNSLLNKWPGLIVTNDGIELEALRFFGTSSVVFAIVHDFYNLKLAIQNTDEVDHFVCHTQVFTRALLSSNTLRDRVKFILHGVRLPAAPIAKKTGGKLKIVSISRLIETKGVLDLITIDEALRSKDVEVEWDIVGSGMLEERLKEQWAGKDNVRFHKPDTQDEVMAIAEAGDIFISPSVFEGYGIALLEAMSRGLVPLIHRLPVGVYSDLPENVGFSMEPGDIDGFVRNIGLLHKDRNLLQEMGRNAERLTAEKYDISKTARAWMEHFRANTTPRITRSGRQKIAGSMGILDRPYVPNQLARWIKKYIHK